jgi:S1-C subfamily serine protease
MDVAPRRNSVVVTKVAVGWPAARAGLKVGDRIQTVGGRWTDTVADLLDALSYCRPGLPAEVVVLRSGKLRKASVHPAWGF